MSQKKITNKQKENARMSSVLLAGVRSSNENSWFWVLDFNIHK